MFLVFNDMKDGVYKRNMVMNTEKSKLRKIEGPLRPKGAHSVQVILLDHQIMLITFREVFYKYQNNYREV